MNRSGALAALLLAVAAIGCERTPDLIVIVADTLRADRLGMQRNGVALTPFLDELATRGARFTDARAASSWTVPSVASLFTSRFPSQHHVVAFDSRLADDEVTLAEVLHAGGFTQMGFTANIRLDAPHGFAQGFDAWAPRGEAPKPRIESVVHGALSYIDTFWYWRPTLWRRLRRIAPPRHLYLHFMEPHGPFEPPEEFARRIAGPPPAGVSVASANERMWTVPFTALSEAEVRYLAALYDAEVAALDHGLRELFDELGSRGLLDRAVVVITADHGEEFGEHRGMGHGATLFDEVLRVPLLLVGPGVPAGIVVREPVSLVDVAPTLLELLGLSPEPRFEGRSLVPWLGGPGGTSHDVLAELLPTTTNQKELQRHRAGLVRGPWKLLAGAIPIQGAMYDVGEDPGEEHPFPTSHPQAVALSAALAAQELDLATRANATAAHAPVDDETRRKLRALGYVP